MPTDLSFSIFHNKKDIAAIDKPINIADSILS